MQDLSKLFENVRVLYQVYRKLARITRGLLDFLCCRLCRAEVCDSGTHYEYIGFMDEAVNSVAHLQRCTDAVQLHAIGRRQRDRPRYQHDMRATVSRFRCQSIAHLARLAIPQIAYRI